MPNGQRKENMDGEREESWFRPQFGVPSSTTQQIRKHVLVLFTILIYFYSFAKRM